MERRFHTTLLLVAPKATRATHLGVGHLLKRLFGPHGMRTVTKPPTPAQGAIRSRKILSVRTPFRGTVFDFSSFFSNAPTAEELLQEAKADLRLDIELIAAKLVILALSFLLSAPATGLYLYTIISIGQGIWKRLNFLSLILLVPFVMLALIFTPGGDAAIGIIALILFACAVGFDISNVCRHVKTIRTLKRS